MQNDDYALYFHIVDWKVHAQKYSYKKTQGVLLAILSTAKCREVVRKIEI
jgi:hypothetical protein